MDAAKSPGAFRTIGEISAELGVPQHILRFWETKFAQLRPVKRSGNRRYYRPEDVALVRRIQHLLDGEGYTIAGVQRLLRQRPADAEGAAGADADHRRADTEAGRPVAGLSGDIRFDRAALQGIRDLLADALERTRAA